MNVKALLKAVGLISLLLGYLALVAWAAHSGSQVFLGIVLAPLVLLAFVIMFVSSYEYFKEEDKK